MTKEYIITWLLLGCCLAQILIDVNVKQRLAKLEQFPITTPATNQTK